MKTAVIVGGGFTGCTMAFLLKEKGFDVTLIEGSGMLGGGCRTHFYHGHPYTFGPHHLIVDKDDIDAWEFFNRFLPHRKLEHHVMTYVSQDDRFYTYPPHVDEVAQMPDNEKIFNELDGSGKKSHVNNFEEYWVNAIGGTLYDKFVNNYSKKMWQIQDNRELDDVPKVLKKTTPLRTTTKEYFEGEKQIGYPLAVDGYNSYFDKCVQGCKVMLNQYVDKFDLDKKGVYVDGKWICGDLLVSTTPVDMLFEHQFGELRFIGRDFLKIILPIERVTPEPYFFLYYAGDEPYTRVFEYKLLTGHKSNDTLIGIEMPSFNNKMYPYPVKSEVEKAKAYFKCLPDNVYSLGRMGKYRYLDMYTILKDGLELMDNL